MVAPRPEFTAQRIITVNGVIGYMPGDNVTTHAVETLGLVIGKDGDVLPAGTYVVPRPAGNATRAAWEAYALGQGMPQEEAQELTRDELRKAFPVEDGDAVPLSEAPAEPDEEDAPEE
jgi:hypothetical protein